MKNTFADSVRAFPYISQPFFFSQRHFFCNDNRFYNTIQYITILLTYTNDNTLYHLQLITYVTYGTFFCTVLFFD